MTSTERRASACLASIFALRMFGMFSLLPVFALYAKDLKGGDSVVWVAIAFSVYGLTEALFQIAFGAASDRIGRKPVIAFGLALFILGSVIAALSTSIYGVFFGRLLQGCAAISSAITAFVADSTRDEIRTKAMAMIGGSIGLAFIFALIVSPSLTGWIGLSGLFWTMATLGAACLLVLYFLVPDAPMQADRNTQVKATDLVVHPQLARLNFGAFALHACLTAVFVVMPGKLVASGLLAAEHWKLYLPIVVGSFILVLLPMFLAERKGAVRGVFLLGIGLLAASFLFPIFFLGNLLVTLIIALAIFFIAFNLLEAMQPSLASRIAPAEAKGLALGIFGTSRAAGVFFGGAAGGILAREFGDNAVFIGCAVLAACWFVVALKMKSPPPARKES